MRFIVAFAATSTLIISVVFYDTITRIMTIAGYVLLGVCGVGMLFGVVFGGLFLWERIKMLRAKRIAAEKDAHVMTVVTEGQVFIRDTNHQAVWRAAHLDPRLYANGHYTEPSPYEQQAWQVFNAPKQIINGQAPPLLPATTESTLELLPLLDSAERVLVKGASDAGKTTLFQHIASRSSGVVIVDPHFVPGLWPENARIIGAGRNFGEISQFLAWLELELDSRYKRRAKGDTNFQGLTVIIDEFMTIAAECAEAGKVISVMIRESRKVGFRLFVGSHSELVKPLGLEGAGDVREGLLIVRLYYSQIRKERRATIDFGEAETPCQFPPFVASGKAGEPVSLPESIFVQPDMVLSGKLTERQMRIAEMIQDGATNDEIAQEIFGKPRLAGAHFYEVRDLRNKLATTNN